MINFGKKDRETPLVGHSAGDFGVIAIAALFAAAGILIFFAKFSFPAAPKPAPEKPSSEVTVGIAPAPQKPVP